jgi:hypothetical protein
VAASGSFTQNCHASPTGGGLGSTNREEDGLTMRAARYPLCSSAAASWPRTSSTARSTPQQPRHAAGRPEDRRSTERKPRLPGMVDSTHPLTGTRAVHSRH